MLCYQEIHFLCSELHLLPLACSSYLHFLDKFEHSEPNLSLPPSPERSLHNWNKQQIALNWCYPPRALQGCSCGRCKAHLLLAAVGKGRVEMQSPGEEPERVWIFPGGFCVFPVLWPDVHLRVLSRAREGGGDRRAERMSQQWGVHQSWAQAGEV